MKKFTYEDRCRKCNTNVEWYFADEDTFAKGFTEKNFMDAMYERLNSPRINFCKICKTETVKDLVAIFIKEHIDPSK